MKRAAAAGLIASAALSLTGCTQGEPKGYVECVGSQSYTVKPGDTLNAVLLRKTIGVEEDTVRDVAIAVAGTGEFKGKGELPTIEVYHAVGATDVSKLTLTTGTTVDIPQQCSN